MAYLTLAVSLELKEIANKICVCLEPDPNINHQDYDAFTTLCVGIENVDNQNGDKAISNKEYLVYGADIKDWLIISVAEWKHNPELLLASIKDIYLNRWNVETDLSLQDCVDFCSDVLISNLYGVGAGINDINLVLKE